VASDGKRRRAAKSTEIGLDDLPTPRSARKGITRLSERPDFLREIYIGRRMLGSRPVHTYVARLRALLGADMIQATRHGYTLPVALADVVRRLLAEELGVEPGDAQLQVELGVTSPGKGLRVPASRGRHRGRGHPDRPSGRAALWRAELAHRRPLALLEDAEHRAGTARRAGIWTVRDHAAQRRLLPVDPPAELRTSGRHHGSRGRATAHDRAQQRAGGRQLRRRAGELDAVE